MSDSYAHMPPQPDAVSESDRSTAKLAHGSALIAMMLTCGSLNCAGPLLMWAINKDRGEFVRVSAAQAFNFNVGMTVMAIAGWICIFVAFLAPVGMLLLPVAWLMQLVCHLKGIGQAGRGELFNYPLRLRLLPE